MGITLAGGAPFPSFDGLIRLGQLIIAIGFFAHIGLALSQLFRGGSLDVFIPGMVKIALALLAINHLNQIGAEAYRTGGLLAQAIAGTDRMDTFLLSIEKTLTAVYKPDAGYLDIMSIKFWFGLASVACMAFAFVSKFIVLEVLWPLYLGLVVLSGTFSISLATLPGMRTAQSWILTLLEAVSWPMIFQILLGIVAAVTKQQITNMDGDFLPLLKGLATLCAVSFLTVMVPILAARLMRGEGASAAMSFVAAKASSLVTGFTARAAVGAAAVPARAAAGPARAALGGGARLATGAAAGAALGAAKSVAQAAPGAALAMSMGRRPPSRPGRAPMQNERSGSGMGAKSPRPNAKGPLTRTSQQSPSAQGGNAANLSPAGQALPAGSTSSSRSADSASEPVSAPQSPVQATTRQDRLKFNAPATQSSGSPSTKESKGSKGSNPMQAKPPRAAWPVPPPPPPLPHINSTLSSPTDRSASKDSASSMPNPRSPSAPAAQAHHSTSNGDVDGAYRAPQHQHTSPEPHGPTGSNAPSAFGAPAGAPSSGPSRSNRTATPQSSRIPTASKPAAAPSAPRQTPASSSRQALAGPKTAARDRQPPITAQGTSFGVPQTGSTLPERTAHPPSGQPRSSLRNIKGSTAESNKAYLSLLQTHPAAAQRIKQAWKADPAPPKSAGEPARRARRDRINAQVRSIVAETKDS